MSGAGSEATTFCWRSRLDQVVDGTCIRHYTGSAMIYRALGVANEECYSAAEARCCANNLKSACQQQMQVLQHLGETLV